MVFLRKVWNFIKSKRFLINLLAIVVFYIIVIFSLKACLKSKTHFGQKIAVPNLIGKNQNNLKALMAPSNLGWIVLDSIYDPTKVEGTILAQDPLPSEESLIFVKEGRKVSVRVSKRTQLVEMPGLVDKSQRFAESILINREFRYKLEYKPSRESNGAVIEQLYKGKQIQPKSKLPIGSRIVLIIGRDETGVSLILPNLYGLTIVEARERVSNMGNMEFLAVCPSCITYSDSIIARITSQSPEFSEGTFITSGTTISAYAEMGFTNEIQE